MKRTLALSLIAFVAAGGRADAQSADPAAGARLAKSECAACHAIGEDEKAKSPDPTAPRFVDVAKMPSTTELSLKVFLRSPHKNMPDILLAPEEIDSVAAYILGLRKK
jgi:mono/diheme cytochrome c family protein